MTRPTIQAMEFTDLNGDTAMLEEAMTSAEWVIQQKFDGARVLIDLSTGEAMTRKGTPLKFAAARQHVDEIVSELREKGVINPRYLHRPPMFLDGELVVETGTYHVFDVFDPTDEFMDYFERWMWVKGLPEMQRVKPVRTAASEPMKRELLARLDEIGAEGAMLKRLDHVYQPGIRVKTALKYKFVKTAEVVITEVRRRPLSAALSVPGEEYGEWVQVGSTSLIGKPEVKVGDVVEINYLYWTGTSVYQPRLKRLRPDKNPGDCTMEQFRPYSREEV